MTLREIKNDEMYKKIIIGGPVICTNAAIYYEDGTPYLKYMGQFEDKDTGAKYVIEFLKISFNIIAIDSYKETYKAIGKFYTYESELETGQCCQNIFFENKIDDDGNYFKIYQVEKDMTKEEIEKELGYPINIV